ncbi:uncharacterized protein N7459_001170 [Penicillium hispanicum]|uniref:uncharacterized protein n=1 Tax=Penicillium hispanicum TaxID=1080232 RepID=UPI00253FA26A|nr:uncharacterized protein N7459_001170 [Penicillium hispanicum]KAJ5594962.1 hypothetical protein N7459_001170 [Penicillium hispanicum]
MIEYVMLLVLHILATFLLGKFIDHHYQHDTTERREHRLLIDNQRAALDRKHKRALEWGHAIQEELQASIRIYDKLIRELHLLQTTRAWQATKSYQAQGLPYRARRITPARVEVGRLGWELGEFLRAIAALDRKERELHRAAVVTE